MTRPIDFLAKPKDWAFTVRFAHDQFACAKCGRDVHPKMGDNGLDRWSDECRREYWISGMCEECQHAFFEEMVE